MRKLTMHKLTMHKLSETFPLNWGISGFEVYRSSEFMGFTNLWVLRIYGDNYSSKFESFVVNLR